MANIYRSLIFLCSILRLNGEDYNRPGRDASSCLKYYALSLLKYDASPFLKCHLSKLKKLMGVVSLRMEMGQKSCDLMSYSVLFVHPVMLLICSPYRRVSCLFFLK